MKNKKSICLGIIFFIFALPAFAGSLSKDGCEQKRLAIERELDYARAYNNVNRVRGLERALARIDIYCQGSYENTAIRDGENPWGDSCDAKRSAIERELTYARGYNNVYRVRGLEKALAEVNTHCSDASIRADLEEDLLDAEEEVREREEDLREAQAKGNPKKIARKQEKLDKAQAELELIRVRLQALKK